MYKVYKVTFPNNKTYIGFTYRDVHTRKKEHYRESESPKKKFHFALRKYKGQEKWEVLNSYLTKDLALKMEQVFIEKCNSLNNGYNLTVGGEGTPNLIRTSQRKKVIDCRGNIFDSIKLCADFYDVTLGTISQSIINKWRVKRKYCVKFYEDGDKACPKYNKSQRLIFCRNNGKVYNGTREICEDLNLPNQLSVSRVCSGVRSSYKGYKFENYNEKDHKHLVGSICNIRFPKRKKPNKIKKVYDNQGNVFKSVKQAAEYHKISEASILFSIKDYRMIFNKLTFRRSSNEF